MAEIQKTNTKYEKALLQVVGRMMRMGLLYVNFVALEGVPSE